MDKKIRLVSTSRIFWYAGRDTLRPHRFDRPGRYPKRFAVLETSQSQKPFAAFGLLRRTPPSGVLIPFLNMQKDDTSKRLYRLLVRRKGFEPPTFWFVAKHSIQLSYRRLCGDPDGNRTRVTAVKGRCLNRLTTGP